MSSLVERLLSPIARGESMRTWPPRAVEKHWDKVEGYRRRYDNDRAERLAYAPTFSSTQYGRRIYTPVALAREVCNFSAEMLFSAPPNITFETNEALLEGVLEANGLDARLTAIGASIATEGRGGLRVIYDTSISDSPLITHVHENEVIWDERHGSFVVGGVVVIERQPVQPNGSNTDVYRLFEEHTRGQVLRQLYKGTSTSRGEPIPIGTYPEFAALPEREDTGLDVPTLIRWDNVSGGYSDLAGAESLLDRIDAEVSYGGEKSEKSRPIAWADADLFDADGNVDLTGVLVRRGEKKLQQIEAAITDPAGVVQPAFLAAETIAWIDYLVDTALMFMGYSKASYGRDPGGSADSGKALHMRQARTLLKKAGKDRMAVEAITNALAIAMAWQSNASSVDAFRPEIELGDGLPRDSMEDAVEVAQWDAAGAISLEEKIRTRRPDWDEEMVQEEVDRLESAKVAELESQQQLMSARTAPEDSGEEEESNT